MLAYYTIANGFIAGICFGFGIISIFIALRYQENRRRNLLFAIFSLAYAATLYNGIRFHNATTVETYVELARADTIFPPLVYIALIWYIAEYTRVKPRGFLLALTAIFIASGVAQLARVNLLYDQILGLNTVIMPWGEQLAYLETTDSVWSLLFLAAQLAVLGYSLFACIRQYQRGERSEALILSIGVLWFVAAIGAELLGQAGIITPIFYGEFGFLGFAVVISIQISNELIKTNEQLAAYRLNLEEMVKRRTAELEVAQGKLIQQTQKETAVEERSRLARDLHDVVAQILFSINMIAISLPRLWKRDPIMAERSTNELQRLSRGALAEMRILLRELRPNTIAEAELGTLLTQLSHGLSARQDITVDIQVCIECDLPPETHLALYRIAQEATNNIAKHAEASHASVKLDCGEEEVCLSIVDDGQGFDVNEIASDKMGLAIMQERANTIAADLTIDSQPGAGTNITVIWKIDQDNEKTNE